MAILTCLPTMVTVPPMGFQVPAESTMVPVPQTQTSVPCSTHVLLSNMHACMHACSTGHARNELAIQLYVGCAEVG